MELRGVVTSIDDMLLSCTLNGKINVYMGLLLSQKPNTKLPEVNSEVILKKFHYFPNRKNIKYAMLCHCSKIEGNFNVSYSKDNKVLKLINEHKLGVTDLLEISRNITVIKENFPALLEQYQSEVMLHIIESIVSAAENICTHEKPCLNQIVHQFDLITINNCKYIDLKSDKYEFLSWKNGVHRKHKSSDYLLGYVSLNKKYGLFQIKDAQYRMFLTITNKDKGNLEDIMNRFVLIKEYVVFTEYYPNNSQNFDYILVDFNDITIINVEDNEKNEIFKETPEIGLYRFSRTFKVIKISTVQYDSRSNRTIFWLQILFKSGENNNFKECIFLCIPPNFLHLFQFLSENESYTIHFNETLKSVNFNDITTIDNSIKQYELTDPNTIFVKNASENVEKNRLMNAFECKNSLETFTELISFEGIVRTKFFEDSRNAIKTSKNPGFGTPGNQVHNLKFFLDDTNFKNTNELKLYFRDWERLLTPLCLVPYMRLAVRNVLPKKTYLKTSTFTKIDVISYEPPVPYTTVNLRYHGEYMPWGEPYFLGAGADIPNNVLVWGRVTNILLNIVNITYICKNCNHILKMAGNCRNCKNSDRKFKVFFSFLASDIEGQSKIISRSTDFLKILLNFSDKQFEIWLKAFEEIGEFEFNRYEEKDYSSLDKTKEYFYEALKEHFEVLNNFDLSSYGLFCLKKKNDPYAKIPKPNWLCLDVKIM
ncbi:unnamed protein product [Brassicogethes aeneus]|uniref:CST complex subunit CTC1 n=1 Tax=Brassicogethes aeneus TaxID=1431903 RepID=A0A9P0AU20_BRAAE|nr:unnamed protein product [Brassicogethes aeneus]